MNKVDLLGLHLAEQAYDVVVLAETHLDSSIADEEIFPPKYTIFRRERKTSYVTLNKFSWIYVLLTIAKSP